MENLSFHPGISFPGGNEVHFWDQHRDRGLDFYAGAFDVPDGRVHGDIATAYAILPIQTIAECHRVFPKLRLIYILRNPIERAIFQAKMEPGKAVLRISRRSPRLSLEDIHREAEVLSTDGITLDTGRLTAFARRECEPHAVPRRFRFVEGMKATAAGKLLRSAAATHGDQANLQMIL